VTADWAPVVTRLRLPQDSGFMRGVSQLRRAEKGTGMRLVPGRGAGQGACGRPGLASLVPTLSKAARIRAADNGG